MIQGSGVAEERAPRRKQLGAELMHLRRVSSLPLRVSVFFTHEVQLTQKCKEELLWGLNKTNQLHNQSDFLSKQRSSLKTLIDRLKF